MLQVFDYIQRKKHKKKEKIRSRRRRKLIIKRSRTGLKQREKNNNETKLYSISKLGLLYIIWTYSVLIIFEPPSFNNIFVKYFNIFNIGNITISI